MPGELTQWIALSSGVLAAEVNPLGAQLSTLRDSAGRDLLWDGDPSVWGGRAPLLFPIVGALSGGVLRLGSKAYPLSRHGFARGKLFELVGSTRSTAIFRLRADDASLELYPFRFELNVHFEMHGSTLLITTHVSNAGDTEMPASFGYHPALRWPLPFGRPRLSHFIEFESDEPAQVRRLNASGLLTPQRHATPIAHRRLVLADELFQDDVIIFDEIRSRSVTYGGADGPRIEVSYPDAPYLGIWTKPHANFICIEPWHGVADPVDFTGDFRVKPGVFIVAAGASIASKMSIALIAG